MNFHSYRPSFRLALLLFVCTYLPPQARSASPALPPDGAGEAQSSAPIPSAASALVTIPGPLRSFLRMAGISQQAPPEGVLPLLGRNVATEGYKDYDRSGGSRHPTEYLILLEEYVKQARELRALAGPAGEIRVSSCSGAGPLLKILGYRLSQPCGAKTSVETADPKRAFLTVDSGFPLADLDATLSGGKPFAYAFPSSQVPDFFSRSDWAEFDRNKKDPDAIDMLLHEPQLARLYWALSQMDGETREFLQRSPGFKKLVPLAAVLDFYGSQICVRSGRVLVPGGAAAEPAWKSLVGAGPDSPARFVTQLVSKDEGWLAAYFDALSRINAAQQAHFANPGRLRSFYEGLRGKNPSPGAARPVFRPDPGLFLLVTSLQWDADGRPLIPGNLEVWKEVLSEHKRGDSKIIAQWAKRARTWKDPDQLVEAMFGFSRIPTQSGPLQIFLTLSEINRRRPPGHRLSAKTVRLLADDFPRYGDQYSIFTEFSGLTDDSIARFLRTAQTLDKITPPSLRGDAVGVFQSNLGLWQILARQGQIPEVHWNSSWRKVLAPFSDAGSSPKLFDAGRRSLGEVLQAAAGQTRLSQDEIIALLAGPEAAGPSARDVKQELADRMRSMMEAQRLVSLDTLFALADGLEGLAKGRQAADALLPLAAELREYQLPKPLFSKSERIEWTYGLVQNFHLQAEMQTDLAKIIKPPGSAAELAAARGRLLPFLRDTLVGLNYAYYEPPGAQMIFNNSLFVRTHEFTGDPATPQDESWSTAEIFNQGLAAGGGAHLIGSLANLPYVLAQVEQNFIVPENVQALIWEDLVPSLLESAVLPRWWRVTRHELRAVALYQQLGEQVVEDAAPRADLRETVVQILSNRMLPAHALRLAGALRAGQAGAALSLLTPGDTFYLGTVIARERGREIQSFGKTGQELARLLQESPGDTSFERISQDFGVPHPALDQTCALELLNLKPFPTFLGYSSRLMAESWDSNNLYWARLADQAGYPPAMLNVLVPRLTRRMVEKIFATDLADWPALLRALRATGEEFQETRAASVEPGGAGPSM
jgi:hypothetical protein